MPNRGQRTQDDAEALRLTAAGDFSAFELFVERHEAAVLRYVRALSGDHATAEDAFQETFVAAWRAAGSFRGRGSARAWLLTIARNAVRRQYRRRVGEPQSEMSLQDLGAFAGWRQESAELIEDRVLRRDLVEKGFAALSAADRELLVLRDLEGFTGEEVAAMLDLSLAAMKSRLHRARLRFMGHLRGELDATG